MQVWKFIPEKPVTEMVSVSQQHSILSEVCFQRRRFCLLVAWSLCVHLTVVQRWPQTSSSPVQLLCFVSSSSTSSSLFSSSSTSRRSLWLASEPRPGEDLGSARHAQLCQSQSCHGNSTGGEPVPQRHLDSQPPVVQSGPPFPLPNPGWSVRGVAFHWQGGQPQGPDSITSTHTLLAGPRRDFRCLLCICRGRCLQEYLSC